MAFSLIDDPGKQPFGFASIVGQVPLAIGDGSRCPAAEFGQGSGL
jgi:hypothetical protein